MQRAIDERAGARRRGRWIRIAAIAVLVFGSAGMGSCCDDEETTIAVTAGAALETASFLGSGDFDGDFTPQQGESEMGGQAKYLGRVVFLHLPRSTVDDVLPGELELAPNTSSTLPELHPVLLIFGHQTETELVYPIGTPDVGEDYRELILMIPFVRKAGGELWHNHVVRMYLEDFGATFLGNQYYGLQKIQADFSESATRFEVLLNALSMFQFGEASTGSWVDDATAETTLSNYTEMKKIVGMPILGQLDYMLGKPFVCSYFEWDLGAAQVRPIAGTANFVEPFTTGMLTWLGEHASVADGAWEVKDLRWRIGFPPFGCAF